MKAIRSCIALAVFALTCTAAAATPQTSPLPTGKPSIEATMVTVPVTNASMALPGVNKAYVSSKTQLRLKCGMNIPLCYCYPGFC